MIVTYLTYTFCSRWASIALATLLIRGATLPLLINQLKATSKLTVSLIISCFISFEMLILAITSLPFGPISFALSHFDVYDAVLLRALGFRHLFKQPACSYKVIFVFFFLV